MRKRRAKKKRKKVKAKVRKTKKRKANLKRNIKKVKKKVRKKAENIVPALTQTLIAHLHPQDPEVAAEKRSDIQKKYN
jgi:hypothetical protein